MRSISLLALTSGCFIAGGKSAPPPPVVDQMTPDRGEYGADVAITGSGFGSGAAGSLTAVGAPAQPEVTSWSDTEIHLRVPFPLPPTAFEIATAGGTVTTPTFTPDPAWTAGPAMAVPSMLLEARVVGGSLVVLAIAGSAATVTTSDGATTTTTALPGITTSTDLRTPTRARLVGDGAGGFEVLGNAGGTVQVFALAGGTVTTFDTGIAGTLLAAGRDATGVLAWVQVAGAQNQPAVELVRPGATSASPWQVARGPISSPDVLDARLAADGTLVVAYGADASNVFDYMQELAIARLAPGATAFASPEYPDSIAWDDYIASAQLAMADDGLRMVAAYSTQQNDETSDHTQTPDVRDAAGRWQAADVVSAAIASNGTFVYTTSGLATLTSDDAGLALVPDVARPTQRMHVPLWPAQPVALVVDGTGAPRPIVGLGTKMWFPKVD